jgi:hypothetical protein
VEHAERFDEERLKEMALQPHTPHHIWAIMYYTIQRRKNFKIERDTV